MNTLKSLVLQVYSIIIEHCCMYSQPPASLPGQVVVQSKCFFPKLKGNGKINQTIIGSLFSDITPILLGNYLPREVSGGRQEMREK